MKRAGEGRDLTCDNRSVLSGFVDVNKSKIQGRFKDFQGHVSGNLKTKMSC